MSPIPNDPYDPCLDYADLMKARKEILTGGGVKRSRLRNGDDEREVEFNTTNLKDLDAAIARARRDCLAATDETGRPARSAIGIGIPGPRTAGVFQK